MEELKNKKELTTSQKLAVIALCLIFGVMLLAILFDFIALKDVILQFVATIIVGALAFVILCIFFAISFVLIFGFFLVEEHGFWPLSLTLDLFKDMFGDIQITVEQLQLFRIFRIILLVLCVAILVLSIISKYMINKDIKEGLFKKYNSKIGVANTAMTFSIMGIIFSVGAIVISNFIK